jgi:hypothetical protein
MIALVLALGLRKVRGAALAELKPVMTNEGLT